MNTICLWIGRAVLVAGGLLLLTKLFWFTLDFVLFATDSATRFYQFVIDDYKKKEKELDKELNKC